MQVVEYPKYQLTSKVIPNKEDGEYSFEVLGFLFSHEALRREFDRGKRAFQNLHMNSDKWKTEAVVEWLDDFLMPMLHVHHYVEDNIIFPFYLALGMAPPERQAEDHIALIGRMNKLQALTRQLVHVTMNSKVGSLENDSKRDSLVNRTRKEYTELVDQCEEHLAEEESFWPPILKRYGLANWMKVERMIHRHTSSFGDSNAGDAYRNTICSICYSMGIMIGKDSMATNPKKEIDIQGNPFLPWAGIGLQTHYVNTRPFPVRKIKIKGWNSRYLQFRQLINSVAVDGKDPSSSTWVMKKNKDGKYVEKYHKPFTPILLFFFISLIFCLACLPFFAAVSNPLRNMKFLHIKVINYDIGGPVGTAFINFLKGVEASSDEIPTFHFESNTGVSLETYQDRVLDGEAWALLAVHPTASTDLAAAAANGCATSASYNPKNSITFSWDEGRNGIVASPYIGGFARGILGQFGVRFASTFLASQPSQNVADCIAAGHSNLLVNPVGYTEDNMTPTSVSFVVSNAGITVGNILMAVFGALFILNATYAATAALAEDYSPVGKVCLKAFTMALVGFGVAICYATASEFLFVCFFLFFYFHNRLFFLQ
jgi:iron-sulfur cluster repair protein YtfE (RIC family)